MQFELLPTGSEEKDVFIRHCIVCNGVFCTRRMNKSICSFSCKEERSRIRARAWQRKKKAPIVKEIFEVKRDQLLSERLKTMPECIVCGFNKTVDLHHVIPKSSGGKDEKNLCPLCPNHHAMIHRNMLELKIIN